MTPAAATAASLRRPPPRGGAREALRRFVRHRAAAAALVVVVGLALLAAFAGPIAPHDPSQQFLRPSTVSAGDPLAARDTGKYAPPSADHWFGTDHLARDIFSRTVLGLRVSIGAAIFAIVVVSLIGVTVGALAAMGPRALDAALMRFTDVAYAFPDLLLIILLRAAFGDTLFGLRHIAGLNAGVLLLFFAIALTAWPTMARLVRAQLLAARHLDYVLAARGLGASPWRLALHHMLPNSASPLIVEATFLVPRAIFAEATLSFIGVGVTPPTPSLGLLINDHFDFVAVQWTALAIPCALLAAMFLAFQFLGDGLRDVLDPRTSRPRA